MTRLVAPIIISCWIIAMALVTFAMQLDTNSCGTNLLLDVTNTHNDRATYLADPITMQSLTLAGNSSAARPSVEFTLDADVDSLVISAMTFTHIPTGNVATLSLDAVLATGDTPTIIPHDTSDWVIADFVSGFVIVDPYTGRLHPNFLDVIDGSLPQWVGDAIWFYSPPPDSIIYRATLDDAEMIPIVDVDFPLRAVSSDEAWIVTYASFPQDIHLYHLPTETRYSLGHHIQEDYAIIITEFSPNHLCLAFVLIEAPIYQQDSVIVYDLRHGAPQLSGVNIIDGIRFNTRLWDRLDE